MNSFIGKTALITGAGSGIGRATAQALARRGAYIYLCDINAQGLEETLSLITTAGGKASTHLCNVADADSVEALAKTVHAEISAVDILINNAGIGSAGRFVDTTLETWNKVVAVT